jgi:hypothetical protein
METITHTMDDDEVIRVAHMMHAVDRGDCDLADFDLAFGAMSFSDKTAVLFAGKLIEGKPYRFLTDNPVTISRARSIAQRLGGVVTSAETDGGMTSIRFDPPSRQ